MKDSRNPKSEHMRQSNTDLRMGSESDVDYGAGIALALGGGFSRGFAHLGVLEILEQEQIPISFIVGTSIGGLLGAAYADGISVRQLCELGRQVRVRDFIRFQRSAKAQQYPGGLPFEPQGKSREGQGKQAERGPGSDGVRLEPVPCDRIGQFVRVWFRANRVEDLPIRTAIVTTDLNTGAPYVFTRGPLDVAIRASCAFPGLFQPVEHEGRWFADGCIVAPVPTAVAAQMNCACVVGVTVGSNPRNLSSSDRVLQVRDPEFRGSRETTPTASWINQADIMIEPEVDQIDWTDFSRVDEAYSAGVDAMRRAVPHLRELLARRGRIHLRDEETSVHSQNGAQSGLAL